jgi:hypothetical protein
VKFDPPQSTGAEFRYVAFLPSFIPSGKRSAIGGSVTVGGTLDS